MANLSNPAVCPPAWLVKRVSAQREDRDPSATSEHKDRSACPPLTDAGYILPGNEGVNGRITDLDAVIRQGKACQGRPRDDGSHPRQSHEEYSPTDGVMSGDRAEQTEQTEDREQWSEDQAW
jgi:hypothetical protein